MTRCDYPLFSPSTSSLPLPLDPDQLRNGVRIMSPAMTKVPLVTRSPTAAVSSSLSLLWEKKLIQEPLELLLQLLVLLLTVSTLKDPKMFQESRVDFDFRRPHNILPIACLLCIKSFAEEFSRWYVQLLLLQKTLSKSLELVQFFAITLGDLLEKIPTYDVQSNRVPSIRNGAIARFYGIMRRRVSKTNCYPVLGKTN